MALFEFTRGQTVTGMGEPVPVHPVCVSSPQVVAIEPRFVNEGGGEWREEGTWLVLTDGESNYWVADSFTNVKRRLGASLGVGAK